MEQYLNLVSPLNDFGVFTGDAEDNTPVNKSVRELPTMTDYLNNLRQQLSIQIGGQNEKITSQMQIQNSSQYLQDMNLSFDELLKQEGIQIRVTSRLRSGARTKSGNTSHHSYKDQWGHSAAMDIVPVDGNFEKLKKDIYSNPRIVAWLVNHDKGILEETTSDVMSKTGATGKHFHVGPDRWAKQMSSKYINYSTMTSNFNSNSNNLEYKTLASAGWNISRPFRNISSYKVNLNSKVNLTKEDLWKQDNGSSQTVHNNNIIGSQTRLGSNLARKHNNPCNISPRKGDPGYIGSSSAADGQKHGGYRSVVEGLASTMKLYLDKYNNKSIRTINNGYQGHLEASRKQYSEQDWKALENLRLLWITHVSDTLGISPFVKLNLNDKETMFSLIAAVAKQESTSTVSRRDLESAWSLLGRS